MSLVQIQGSRERDFTPEYGNSKVTRQKMYIGCEELVAMKQLTTNSDTQREGGKVNPADYIDVNISAYSFAKCCHWRNRVKST